MQRAALHTDHHFVGWLIVALVSAFAFPHLAKATPFVPIEWQQRIKSGLLEDQRKHTSWVRDLNVNYIDDALEAMDPGTNTTVIVQMNECLDPQAIAQKLGAFGTVRRIGTLVAYVILDNVKVSDVSMIASDPAVAGVEADQLAFANLDTGTREVRARSSATYSPETFEDAFGFDGTGINVAIMDTGVDDAVHGGFAGKFVSGFNALTATPGNPNDDNASLPFVTTGPNGIANSTAAGDDTQLVPVGQGFPDPNAFSFPITAIMPGANGVIDTVPAGDDSVGTNPCDGGTPYLRPGADGLCNSTAAGDDIQIIPVGQGAPNILAVRPGANGAVNTALGGDDTLFPGVWHGTHVAGTAIALGVGPGCRPADDGSGGNDCEGMAPGSGLVDVKVLDSGGSGSVAGIIDALEWIWTDGNARVVNMSLGIDSAADGTDTISKVINALVANGIAVVVSAGNSSGKCLGPVAAAELAITVAAVDDRNTVDRDDDRIATFSTFGPRVDFDALNPKVGHLKPDIAAPGVNSTSTQGDSAGSYHALDGTSQAAPYVTGALALLFDMEPALTPGSAKELLKRTAYITPQHFDLGPTFPAVDPRYNDHWGFGLLDVYQAGQALEAGIADVAFTACTGCGSGANCDIPGANYANSTDIQLATDPPVQGEPNTITLFVENLDPALAEDVVVCVGVKELGAGLNEFYDVGCKTIDVGALATTSVSFPWTPTFNGHQCIQANINYGFDKEFCNNQTQRNTSPVPASSTSIAHFRVENPFPEVATIMLTPRFGGGNDGVRMEFKGPRQITLRPQDCAVEVEVAFTPGAALPFGTKATWNIDATGFTASKPDGVELSGVQFEVEVVPSGLLRAYSIERHGEEGRIRLPLRLAGTPTSDPRSAVTEILAVFNVVVRASEGKVIPQDITITSTKKNPIPSYSVAFAEGADSGTELTILFSQPLVDEDRYLFQFGRLVDGDGSALEGDSDFELRVLQGDANGSGIVTATDVSFVRGRINQLVAFGDTSRADPNRTGAISGPDVSFVRARINHSAP